MVGVGVGKCSKCRHVPHIGECGRTIEIQGVEQQCICVVMTPSAANKGHLRQADAAQQRQVADALRRRTDPRRPPLFDRQPPPL